MNGTLGKLWEHEWIIYEKQRKHVGKPWKHLKTMGESL